VTYTGPERRQVVQDHRDPVIICKQENKIVDMSDGIIRIEGRIEKLDLRINGTLEKMANHVEDSEFWRRFIMGTAVSLVISILSGAYALWFLTYNIGQYTKQIQMDAAYISEMREQELQAQAIRSSNTARIQNLEEYHRNNNK
jgi:PIN domain nuclease of toxin-antitoxin system